MEQGKVVSLQVCVGHREPMSSRERVTVREGGLEGDRHANVNSFRQILLMEKEILDGLSLSPGTIRENVTIEGLAIHGLEAGRAGASGVGGGVGGNGTVRAVQQQMDEIRDGLRVTLDQRRGVLTRVVTGGEVGLGDGVEVG